MLAIFQIPIMPDHRRDLYFYIVEQLYLGNHPQTLVATSTNHSEIIALYEASRECVWLCRMINHIQQSCGIGHINEPTIIYEDNSACIAQMNMGYTRATSQRT